MSNMFTAPSKMPSTEEMILRFARRGYQVEFTYNPFLNSLAVYIRSGVTKTVISHMVSVNDIEDVPGSLTYALVKLWRELTRREVL